METQPTTFTRKTRTRQIILGVLVTALIVALVVAVIVLAILLDRKKINDTDGGDEGEQVQNGSRRENTSVFGGLRTTKAQTSLRIPEDSFSRDEAQIESCPTICIMRNFSIHIYTIRLGLTFCT